jgi:hypothetical protein
VDVDQNASRYGLIVSIFGAEISCSGTIAGILKVFLCSDM